mmetsp:Transcript_54252/g.129264  ORF Transcript_54252/g.129264 Transcript_54252/m.129264 type:complete len:550 (+) Transcript_54252:228-1877(+)
MSRGGQRGGALTKAAGDGVMDEVRRLLAAGASISEKDSDGWTPLWVAARNGHLKVVRVLVEEGADKNTKNSDGDTPLSTAALYNHVLVVQFLVEAGANKNSPDKHGWTPLFTGAAHGHLLVVQALVKAGADTNAKDMTGATPLWTAAGHGHVAVVRALVDAGADKNATDKRGFTPVFIAACNNHEVVVRVLLQAGADVTLKDKTGRTPLVVAKGEAVRKLLQEDASDRSTFEALHSDMIQTAAKLGELFGRGNKGKHTQAVSSLRFGDKTTAALGLYDFMGVKPGVVSAGMYEGSGDRVGVNAIVREFEAHGSDDDRLCLEYVLREEAGSCKTLYDNGYMDCDEQGGLLEERRCWDKDEGLRFDDFLKHRNVKDAKLNAGHVLALRLYTTYAFQSINAPLRASDIGETNPHKLPVTVALLAEAVKQLRVVEGKKGASSNAAVDLYRGMQGVQVPQEFMSSGGTEMAPMSTTLCLETAMEFSSGDGAVLLRLRTKDSLTRGVDISFLSAFPAEKEILFPPLTRLKALGPAKLVTIRDCSIHVVDVEPILP